MRILVSNDDGVAAPGLAALRAVAAAIGEVTVVAPAVHESATGHAITLKRPLTVRRARLAGEGEAFGLSVDGRPADCVRLAIRRLMDPPPELVLTGINAGANVGVNVFYSGTVAAAAEAAMMNIPAVAFSAEIRRGQVDFARAGDLCARVLGRLLAAGLGAGDLINVNLPDCGPARPRGVRVVKQSTAGVEDLYEPNGAGEAHESYLLADEFRFVGHENDDVACLAEGFITVTPLRVDMTAHEKLAVWSGAGWDDLLS